MISYQIMKLEKYKSLIVELKKNMNLKHYKMITNPALYLLQCTLFIVHHKPQLQDISWVMYIKVLSGTKHSNIKLNI